ncbi:39S ribosomal protein L38, mitochondrial isoform X1 [Pseudomyrmex gracilis]|uniref:39S ribosomal protein L38, mitochondrial isoform X1 n=1 Tax=Pseudomyrmex gracilis TaxID=219809 RepID=UPI000994901A|nr:39S ribosomal protein L38, mitochondrial isoform X1 [Pseudomyrmex gracilis]XP_020297057.1 39S ribosomal protein L38, mitochondrial isoform X1 [Pseudomyrmex gracilis]
MSTKLFRCLTNKLLILKVQHVRHAHRVRGKPPGIAKSLKERLAELSQGDSTVDFKIDIGFPVEKITRRNVPSSWIKKISANKHSSELERFSRTKTLMVDLQKARKDWLLADGPFHIHRIAEHYSIYKDLYGDAYFMPTIPLNISYNLENDKLINVYNGNVIKPNEASKAPQVTYNVKDESLWTLLMTTPDCNLTSSCNEYCHWFIGNIPGNCLNEGEELVDYLRPIAPYGIGYCRYIFVLYKQECPIDFSGYKRTKPCLTLEERNWKTLDFYKKHQDQLTPAGLAFFQSDWDSSLKDFYYSTLNMKVPVFRYDFPKPYVKKQAWFPLKKAFNKYLDRYRDPKQINKEFLLKKLKKTHPFNGPEPSLKYPMAHRLPWDMPSWLKFETIKERLRYGRINDIEEY